MFWGLGGFFCRLRGGYGVIARGAVEVQSSATKSPSLKLDFFRRYELALVDGAHWDCLIPNINRAQPLNKSWALFR